MLSPNIAQMTKKGSFVEIMALAAASSLAVGFFYVANDGTNYRWFMARTTSSLEEIANVPDFVKSVQGTGPVPLTVDSSGKLSATFQYSDDAGNAIVTGTDGKPFVAVPTSLFQNVDSTSTATLSVDGNQKLVANVKLSTAQYQNVSVDAEGLFVPALRIAAGSANLASITNNELTVVAPRITQIHSAAQYNSLASFVAAVNSGAWVPPNGQTLTTGDVILTANGTENYWYGGVTNPTMSALLAQEFYTIEGGEYTADDIRSLFAAGNSLTYNVNTGVFDVVLSGMATNDLQLDFENKLFINVAYTNVVTVDETGTSTTNTLTNLLADIYSQLGNVQTTFANDANNGLTKNGNVIGLGGTLLADTTVAQASKKMTFSGGALQVESSFNVPIYNTDATSGLKTSRVGTDYAEIFVDAYGQLNVVLPN